MAIAGVARVGLAKIFSGNSAHAYIGQDCTGNVSSGQIISIWLEYYLTA